MNIYIEKHNPNVEVEAYQLTPENLQAKLADWLAEYRSNFSYDSKKEIALLKQKHYNNSTELFDTVIIEAKMGDWIIRRTDSTYITMTQPMFRVAYLPLYFKEYYKNTSDLIKMLDAHCVEFRDFKEGSEEENVALVKLREACMWLRQNLKRMEHQNPYAEDYMLGNLLYRI